MDAWVMQVPPITRAWLALSVATSLAVVRPSWSLHKNLITYSVSPSNVRSLLRYSSTSPSSLRSLTHRSVLHNLVVPVASSRRWVLEAVANAYHLLLFWSPLARFRIPSVLLVSVFCVSGSGLVLDVFYLSTQYALQSYVGGIIVCE